MFLSNILGLTIKEKNGRVISTFQMYSDLAQSYFDEFPFTRGVKRRPSSEYFFLSHAHADHTKGLSGILSDPDATIVCSRETAAAIRYLHRIPPEKCLLIKPNQSLDFDEYMIHAVDANHCVGSLMFVIESPKGIKEVYTGDFRLGPQHHAELELLRNPDHLWVDFTYGTDPMYTFPPREKLISDIISLILTPGNYPDKNVWIATYQIGKELLLRTISQALKVKIWAPSQKVRIFRAIGGEWDVFTESEDSGIFVGTRRMVENLKTEDNHQQKQISESLRISPTGWAIKLNNKRLDVHFFPYSDHSSYSEVHEFVQLVEPQQMTPI